MDLTVKSYQVDHYRLQLREYSLILRLRRRTGAPIAYNRLHCFTAGASHMRRTKEAEEWHDVDAALFKNTIRPRGRPAILRGLVQAWPATQAGRESPAVAHRLSQVVLQRPCRTPVRRSRSHQRAILLQRHAGRFQFRIQARAAQRCAGPARHESGERVRTRPVRRLGLPADLLSRIFQCQPRPRPDQRRVGASSRSGSEIAPASRRISTTSRTLPVSSADAAASPCFRPSRSAISTSARST